MNATNTADKYTFPFFVSTRNYKLFCACCDYPIWLSLNCESPCKRNVCQHCQAIVCEACVYKQRKSLGYRLNCRWCCNQIGNRKVFFGMPGQPTLQTYLIVDNGIAIFQEWRRTLIYQNKKFDFSQIIWKDEVDTKGWKFFLEIKKKIKIQHPTQFRYFMSMAMWNILRHIPQLRNQVDRTERVKFLLDSSSEFHRIPQSLKWIYPKTYIFLLMQNFSIFMLCKLSLKKHPKLFLMICKRIYSFHSQRIHDGIGIRPK